MTQAQSSHHPDDRWGALCCPECGWPELRIVEWTPREDGDWDLRITCPACKWSGDAGAPREAVARYVAAAERVGEIEARHVPPEDLR